VAHAGVRHQLAAIKLLGAEAHDLLVRAVLHGEISRSDNTVDNSESKK
jgi:hypothetical protein